MTGPVIPLNLLISAVAGNMAGVNAAKDGLNQVTGAAKSLFGAIESGVGIDIGARLVRGIVALGDAMVSVIKTGLAFNQTLESTQLGIAAILRSTDTAGNFNNFNQAVKASAAIMGQLKVGALTSAADFEGLAMAYQTTAASMSAASIPIGKQVQLMILLGNAIKAQLGPMADSRQLMTESRALLEGRTVPGAQLATSILRTQADKDAFEQAKQNGTAFEFLAEKLKAFKEAADLANNTMGVLVSNIHDLNQQISASFTKPLFDAIKIQIQTFTAFLQSGEIARVMQPFGDAIAVGVGVVARALTGLLPVAVAIVGGLKPIFDVAQHAFATLGEVMVDGVDRLKELFDDPEFSARWKESMDAIADAMLTILPSLEKLTGALVEFLIAVVKGMPAYINFAVAATPLLVIFSETLASTADALAFFSDRMVSSSDQFSRATLSVATAVNSQSTALAILGVVWATYYQNHIRGAKGATDANGKVTKSFQEILKAAQEAGQKLLDSLKPPPKSEAQNILEERLQVQKLAAKKELDLAGIQNKSVQADESKTFAQRQDNLVAYWNLKRSTLETEVELERQIIAEQMKKGTLDEQNTLKTKLQAINDTYQVAVTQLNTETNDSLTKLKNTDDTRNDKIQEAVTLRTLELSLTNALADGDTAKAARLQRVIDLETETNRILQERDQDRSKFASAEDFEDARRQARSDASVSLKAKVKATSSAYLLDLKEQTKEATAQNTTGEEGVRTLQEQFAIQKILVEAAKESAGIDQEILDLAEKLTGEMNKQNALQRALRQLDTDKAKGAVAVAQAQTDVVRAQNDLSLGPDEIAAVQRKGLQAQLTATQALIKSEEKRQALITNDPLGLANSQATVEGLNQKVIELNKSLETVGDTAGTVRNAIHDWALSFGTIGDQIAKFATNSMTTVTDKVSDGIYQMAVAGKGFKTAMLDALSSIGQGLIKLVVQFITQKLVLLAFGKVFNAQMLAGDAGTAGAMTAIWTPAAIMKSIATMGIAAIVGFAIFAAIAGAAGAFAEGGLIPGTPSKKDNRLAMVATGEHITQSPAVTYYGASLFAGLNEMKIPRERLYAALAGISLPTPRTTARARAFAEGGLVADLGQGEASGIAVKPADIHIGILRDHSDIKNWAESSDGQKVLLRAISSNRMNLGLS